MKPWYGGINNHDDLKDCTPESFKFHGTFKSIARLKAIKETYVDENIINRICLTYNDDLLKASLKRARS